MRFFARICALILCMAMLFTLGACHKKGETVMTIGDVEISSGLYLAFLTEAFNQFAQHKDIADAIGTDTTISSKDYFEYELEGKDAVTWMKDKAKSLCSEYAAVKTFFKEYDLSVSDAELEYLDSYVEYYWDEGGYDKYYESNGVSKETYRETLIFYTMKSILFNYYYSKPDEETGKGGIKEVPMSELLKKLEEDYVLIESLSISKEDTKDGKTVSKTDVEIADAKKKLEKYADRINRGSATFDEISKEYKKEIGENVESTETTPDTEDAHDHDHEHEDELKSIYPSTATLYSKNDTDSNGQPATENYDRYMDIKDENDISYGNAAVVDEGNNLTLIIFYDLSKDEFYADQCRTNILKSLKDDEFEDLLNEKVGTLTIDVQNSLVKYYSPKKLDFGEDEHDHAH